MSVRIAAPAERGFTLIELVVGILVFAIAMVALVNVFAPQIRKGIDPIWQVRAVTLAQSLSSEIRAKSFDENTQFANVGGPCGSSQACTQSGSLGPDVGETRPFFDDVDDFHGLVLQGSDIANSLGLTTDFSGVDVYSGFSVSISVFYDDNEDGINDDDLDNNGTLDSGVLIGTRKLVQITVQTPSGENMVFAMFRNNY
jgi:MSHA pilin protein MshD